jgi:hypothetical protein
MIMKSEDDFPRQSTIGSDCLPLSAVLALLDVPTSRGAPPPRGAASMEPTELKVAVVQLRGRPLELDKPPRKPSLRRRSRKRRRARIEAKRLWRRRSRSRRGERHSSMDTGGAPA